MSSAFSRSRAEVYRQDNSSATVRFLDSGHFVLETHVEKIAFVMRQFLSKSSG
jgi:surfactin synthase thioesterase subunit